MHLARVTMETVARAERDAAIGQFDPRGRSWRHLATGDGGSSTFAVRDFQSLQCLAISMGL